MGMKSRRLRIFPQAPVPTWSIGTAGLLVHRLGEESTAADVPAHTALEGPLGAARESLLLGAPVAIRPRGGTRRA